MRRKVRRGFKCVESRKRCVRVGGRSVSVDVRFIAATNMDFAQAVLQRRFRSDLYYRLNAFPITLPPLRDRREDIPLLAQHFLQRCRAKLQRGNLMFHDPALTRLAQYDWPGNFRELQNVIERPFSLRPISSKLPNAW
ncbi:sigma 54-interacting transcriptional regulator [Nitrospira sp. NS4]|uniref:sigma 54-interacting transcriptional regulator n=1 Tax=Nitrospira sp. NS4 TaxID=3414498 RepID=UPI003C2D3691